MLVARAGLGAAEIALAQPAFLAAVRWALFAEKVADGLADLRAAVATDPPDGLRGADRMAFIETRKRLREDLRQRLAALHLGEPPDTAT